MHGARTAGVELVDAQQVPWQPQLQPSCAQELQQCLSEPAVDDHVKRLRFWVCTWGVVPRRNGSFRCCIMLPEGVAVGDP